MPRLNNLNGLIYAALLQLYWSCLKVGLLL